MGLAGKDLTAAAELDGTKIREIAGLFEEEKGWVVLGSRIPADRAAGMEAGVADLVSEHVALLAPVLQLIAWSPRETTRCPWTTWWAQHRKTVEAAQAELESERSEREAPAVLEEEERRQALRREVEEKARADQAWRRRERLFRRTVATPTCRRGGGEEGRRPGADPPLRRPPWTTTSATSSPRASRSRWRPRPIPRRPGASPGNGTTDRGAVIGKAQAEAAPRRDDKRGPRRENRDRPAPPRQGLEGTPGSSRRPPAPTKVSKERMEKRGRRRRRHRSEGLPQGALRHRPERGREG